MMTTTTSVAIETRRPGDEEARQDLSRHAFGKAAPFDRSMPRVHPERDVCAYVGDRLVGAAATLGAKQLFGGQLVTMGAVASVIVLPEFSGRGIASRLIHESLDRMRQRGEVISALYPTLPGLYRRLGYGVSGSWIESELPLDALPIGKPAGSLQTIEDPQLGPLRQAYDRLAAGHPGWVHFDDQHWERLAYVHQRNPLSFAYETRREDGTTAGAVLYRLALDRPVPEVVVDLMAANGLEAWGWLLAALRWNSPAAQRMVTTLPPQVLVNLVPQAATALKVRSHREWMTRIVDLAGAVEARGWATTTEADIHVQLTHRGEVLPEHRGIMRIAGGRAVFEPGGSGDLELELADFSGLYTGRITPFQAANLGLFSRYRPSALEAFEAAVGTGAPSCVHHF